MAITQPWLRGVFGVSTPVRLWWDIQPISAGVFGVPVGFAVIVIVSLLTKPPSEETLRLVDWIRAPESEAPPDRRASAPIVLK
jgi:cation/acetate symporter